MSHAASASFNSSLLCVHPSVALTLPGASDVLKMSRFGLKRPPNVMWHVLLGCGVVSSSVCARCFVCLGLCCVFSLHTLEDVLFFSTILVGRRRNSNYEPLPASVLNISWWKRSNKWKTYTVDRSSDASIWHVCSSVFLQRCLWE